MRPGDLGIDCMHINLHKTFSTPHGGGGPGSGPVVLAQSLAPFAPLPWVVHDGAGFRLIETRTGEAAQAIGRIKEFHGQFGMFVRALAFAMSHGADGLRQVSGDAVLNANYVLERVKDVMTPSYPGPAMHEALFDDRFLDGTGVTTLDFAKALIDEGFHPMTMYFPLDRPRRAADRADREREQGRARPLHRRAAPPRRARPCAGGADFFRAAPHLAPRRRLDETTAARKPVLRWRPTREAAE